MPKIDSHSRLTCTRAVSGILRADQPARESHAVDGGPGRQGGEDGRHPGLNFFAEVTEVSAQLDVGAAPLVGGQLPHDQRPLNWHLGEQPPQLGAPLALGDRLRCDFHGVVGQQTFPFLLGAIRLCFAQGGEHRLRGAQDFVHARLGGDTEAEMVERGEELERLLFQGDDQSFARLQHEGLFGFHRQRLRRADRAGVAPTGADGAAFAQIGILGMRVRDDQKLVMVGGRVAGVHAREFGLDRFVEPELATRPRERRDVEAPRRAGGWRRAR
jgi:hypothetical protein